LSQRNDDPIHGEKKNGEEEEWRRRLRPRLQRRLKRSFQEKEKRRRERDVKDPLFSFFWSSASVSAA
jgi:hypothetical protein